MQSKIVFALFNPFFVVFSLFFVIVLLYSFQLSTLYDPSVLFILYLFTIIIPLLLFSFSVDRKSIKYKINFLASRLQPSSTAWIFCVLLFLIGSISNIYEYYHVGWPIFLDNKVTRGETLHYVHYLTNFLIYVLPVTYFLFREERRLIFKFFALLLFVFTFVELAVWLNRGFVTLFVLFLFYYEVVRAYKAKKFKNFIVKVIVMMLLFGVFFGYVGDLRVQYVMENVYGYSINTHYGMPEWMPTSLVWLYIYFTSSLENFRHIFMEQNISDFRYGLLLVYPFVAPIFKSIFEERVVYFPYLDEIAGLNVSTFMSDAINDFGAVGPYLYVLYMILFLFLALKFMARGLFGLLLFVSVINMSFWMLFVNGFAVGPFMIGTIFFAIASYFFESKKGGR